MRTTEQRLQPGKTLQVLREAAGLTQAALAARAGLTQAAVSDLERGRRPGRLDTWVRLADALKLQLGVFFSL